MATQVRLINGDCLNESNYPDFKVDLILFDPPFPTKKDNKGYAQIRKKNKVQLDPIKIFTYAQWDHLIPILPQYLKPSGWLGVKLDDFGFGFTFREFMKYFDFISNRVWDKGMIKTGFYVRKQHELIALWRPLKYKNTYWLKPPKKDGLKSASHGNSKGKAFSSIFKLKSFNNGTKGSEGKQTHINQTPIEVWREPIKYMCPKGGWILDPTMGLGSVGQMAKKLGMNYWGIEIEEKFHSIAQKKIDKIQTQTLDFFKKG